MKNDKTKKLLRVSSIVFSALSIIIVVFIFSMIGIGWLTGEMSTQLLPIVCSSIATAILAFGSELIFIRQDNQQLQDSVNDISAKVENIQEDIVSESINMDKVLITRDQLKLLQVQKVGNMYADARRIDMSGMSLRGNVYDNYASFQQMLRNGGICHFVMVNPNGKAPEIIAKRYDNHKDVAKYTEEIRQALSRLVMLKEEFPDRVKITLVDHIPSTSITIINKDSEDRRCFIEIYTYNIYKNNKSFNISRPHIFLSNENSAYWIDYFVAQFDETERIGTVYEGEE